MTAGWIAIAVGFVLGAASGWAAILYALRWALKTEAGRERFARRFSRRAGFRDIPGWTFDTVWPRTNVSGLESQFYDDKTLIAANHSTVVIAHRVPLQNAKAIMDGLCRRRERLSQAERDRLHQQLRRAMEPLDEEEREHFFDAIGRERRERVAEALTPPPEVAPPPVQPVANEGEGVSWVSIPLNEARLIPTQLLPAANLFVPPAWDTPSWMVALRATVSNTLRQRVLVNWQTTITYRVVDHSYEMTAEAECVHPATLQSQPVRLRAIFSAEAVERSAELLGALCPLFLRQYEDWLGTPASAANAATQSDSLVRVVLPMREAPRVTAQVNVYTQVASTPTPSAPPAPSDPTRAPQRRLSLDEEPE